MKQQFPAEKPHIECVDHWSPCTITEADMLAYKRVEQTGQIQNIKVEIRRNTQRVVVKYLSAIPHEWVLELLGKTKRENTTQQTKQFEELEKAFELLA